MKHIIVFALAASLSFCAFGEERVFLKCDKPLRFEFSDAKWRGFSLPGAKEAIAAIPPENRPREFYINPHPQKVIASLRLKKATSVIDYSLFALTLRDCRK